MEYIGIFQGGGIKGMAYIGAICALEEKGFKCVKASGTSIGAIFASLIATGYSGIEMANIMRDIDFQKLLYTPRKKYIGFIKDKGFYDSCYISSCLDYFYSLKGYRYINDLYNKELKLKVIASDITKHKKLILPDDFVFYNVDKNKVKISEMVTMSMLFPCFFKPKRLDKSLILDGGLYDNFPINAFEDQKLIKIGFRVLNKKVKNLSDLDYVIDIDTSFMKILNFKITNEELEKLFRVGYYSAKKALQDIKNI